MRQGLLAVLLSAVVVLGCGDGLRRVSVQGKLTAKGGDPIGNATISFLPSGSTKGEGAIGTTDKDGNFTLTGSRQGASGIVPGTYKVRVSRFVDKDGTVLSSDAKQVDFPHAVESVPAPFSAPDSPLEVTVPDRGGALNVEVPAKMLGKK